MLVSLAAGITILAAIPYIFYLLGILWRRPKAPFAAKDDLEPTVSIVLPTYNEAEIVDSKLEDIRSLEYPTDKLELVVVDSSDDGTPNRIRAYVEAHEEFPEIKIIEETDRRGLAPALNDAYNVAKNEIVLKTDCDSRIAENALREAVMNFADDSVGAVTGRNTDVLGSSKVESGYRGIQARIQAFESHLDSTLIFHGPFSAFRNEAIVSIDPNSLADDTELALKIRRGGQRAIFDPTVEYMEAAHSGIRSRRVQKDRRAMGLIRLLIQHRDALGRYGNFGRIVLPFNWWFMIVSPWLILTAIITVIAAAIGTFGLLGIGFPLAIVGFVAFGQADRLGRVQPLYSVLDTQISLFLASIKLLRGQGDGTWEVDAELREIYD